MIARVASAFAFGTVVPAWRRASDLGPATVAALPVVGVTLGLFAAGTVWAGRWAFGPHSFLAAVMAVAALLLLTRGLHLDGLADTADGLGCYGSPDRALSVMREGTVGPFGVAAVVVVIMTEAGALSAMSPGWSGAAAVVTAVTAGRVAAVLTCQRGFPAARGSSLGARVAESQTLSALAGWTVVAAMLSVPATPRPWQGPVVVVFALATTAVAVRHCVRRFGGVTGDVMGAAIELTNALTLVGLSIRP